MEKAVTLLTETQKSPRSPSSRLTKNAEWYHLCIENRMPLGRYAQEIRVVHYLLAQASSIQQIQLPKSSILRMDQTKSDPSDCRQSSIRTRLTVFFVEYNYQKTENEHLARDASCCQNIAQMDEINYKW
jgi:hypothetical protein